MNKSYFDLNSKDRRSGESLNNVSFSNFNLINVTRIEVEEVSVSYSWYDIQTAYNSTLVIINPTGPTTYTINITPGSYSGTELATALQTALNAAWANSFVVTFNSNNGKFTISGTSTFTIDSTSTILGVLGLVASSGTNSYTSTNVANLHFTEYINFNSSELHNNLPNFTSSDLRNGQRFIRIPVSNYAFGDRIVYHPHHPIELAYNNPISLPSLNITVTDQLDRLIEFNSSANWNIRLKVYSSRF